MARRISNGISGKNVLGSIVAVNNSLRPVTDNDDVILQASGTGIASSNTDFQINNGNSLRLSDDNSSNYVSLTAPTTVSSNITYTLPGVDGSNTQVLTTDGNGTLSWQTQELAITNRTSADNSIYFLAMTSADTGTSSILNVANNNRLQFVPNPGRLTVNQIAIQSTAASSSVSTGALTVAGGVGVGGQLTATTIVETSSIALKENIHPIENALDKIVQLAGVVYDRKDGSSKNEPGLIAEDVYKIIPELVTENSNGVYYTKIGAYLIEAVKTLKDEIDLLKKQK